MNRVDVAVIGAGPAGLAAAVRARWVKSHRAIPASVAVFDPAVPGGLARLRSTRLTGPGYRLAAADLVSRLMADVETFRIPIARRAVDLVVRAGNRWRLFGGGEPLCSARTVVLATGLRRLANEAEFFGRGLSLTHNAYGMLAADLDGMLMATSAQTLAVIGNAKTVNLLPVLDRVRGQGTKLLFLLDEPPSAALASQFPGETHFGRLKELRGAEKIAAMLAVDERGAESVIPCEAAYIDYIAFEVKPQHSVCVEGLERDERGFVRILRDGATNLDGVFAAGDATGLYAMALKALSEGALAGFAAYRYTFERKFGYAPSLFAYAAEDRTVDPDASDYPVLPPDCFIEPVSEPRSLTRCALVRSGLDFVLDDAVDAIPYESLCARFGAEAARGLAYAWFDEKLCTVQPKEEAHD